jgi:aryl-alcohol dehydrogenase-like predicted oxidoreductase
VLSRVGRRHGGASPSAVALAWALQQPAVAAAAVGARNALHLGDLRRAAALRLDEADMLDIDAAYEGAHQPASDVYAWERGGNW